MGENYEPYGKEWFVEMMKISKSKILELFREECMKNRDPKLERVIRDAVISYNEMFPSAPNDDCENELRERAKVANGWLKYHGFEEEKFFFDKPKECGVAVCD